MSRAATLGLFVLTAMAEILGCYLPWVWLRREGSVWLLMPAIICLAAFAWLLTLHPELPAGRTYAAYGGVYVCTALAWMWAAQGLVPDRWDLAGGALTLLGMSLIAFGPRS